MYKNIKSIHFCLAPEAYFPPVDLLSTRMRSLCERMDACESIVGHLSTHPTLPSCSTGHQIMRQSYDLRSHLIEQVFRNKIYMPPGEPNMQPISHGHGHRCRSERWNGFSQSVGHWQQSKTEESGRLQVGEILLCMTRYAGHRSKIVASTNHRQKQCRFSFINFNNVRGYHEIICGCSYRSPYNNEG